ncbi:hypothetical protein [Blautia sp. MSJ-19]|uniref:hypothetical protein n=1 Tax=Blautia sp. MSJ-19 TaxID=2841517 RepID=UPI001C0F066C|nr:hypothetical protein [Blautia sp. MSJ-19]MBU5482629.1 hypothetical protein [Blautia sp. MSJ-19]
MSNARTVMNYAEYLVDCNEQIKIRDYYCQQSSILEEDVFNHIVILLTMCVNRELQMLLDVEDDNISAEKYPERVMEIHKEISKAYTGENKKVAYGENIPDADRDMFFKYLNHMVICLLSGIKYIEKKDTEWNPCDEENEWNTRFRREERIRDKMKCIISANIPSTETFTKFTMAHHIEIPYMYVLAWDLPKLFDRFNASKPDGPDDKSYIGNLRKNTSIELGFIGENLLEILLHRCQTDQSDVGDPNEVITISRRVDYINLLPTILLVDHVDYSNKFAADSRARTMARKKHIVPYMKKEILKRRPLLPMEAERKMFGSEKSLEMMVAFLSEERKTKEYLESDIVYLRDCMMDMCHKLLDWIFKGNTNILTNGMERDAVGEYLVQIIGAVNNDPRKNTVENRNTYIGNVVTTIVRNWDTTNLSRERTIDGNSDSYIRYAYFSVLKLARNWNGHNLLKNVSIHFCVFVYLVSIRYMIDLDKLDIESFTDYLHLEARLLKLLGENKQVYNQLSLEELDKEYRLLYERVCNTAFDKNLNCGEFPSWVKDFPRDIEERKPHQILNVAGHSKSKIKDNMSENEIFLTFWLSAHMGANNTERKVDRTRDINIIEIFDRIYEYQKKSELLKIE